MQLSGISTLAPVSSVLSTLPASQSTKALPPLASQANSAQTDTALPTVPAATPAAAPARSAPAAPAASASALATAELLAAVYSTTVGGKQYSGDVEQSGSQYSITIPGVLGATATGSSIAGVETNLRNIIDLVV